MGVPAVAVLYTLFKAYIKQRLENKALPSTTEAYAKVDVNPYQIEKKLDVIKAKEKDNEAESAKTDS